MVIHHQLCFFYKIDPRNVFRDVVGMVCMANMFPAIKIRNLQGVGVCKLHHLIEGSAWRSS